MIEDKLNKLYNQKSPRYEGFFIKGLVTTYSPTESPRQYHQLSRA